MVTTPPERYMIVVPIGDDLANDETALTQLEADQPDYWRQRCTDDGGTPTDQPTTHREPNPTHGLTTRDPDTGDLHTDHVQLYLVTIGNATREVNAR